MQLVGFKRLTYGISQFQKRIQNNSWAESEAKIMNYWGRGGTMNTQNKYKI
jgi:hypothetical protein